MCRGHQGTVYPKITLLIHPKPMTYFFKTHKIYGQNMDKPSHWVTFFFNYIWVCPYVTRSWVKTTQPKQEKWIDKLLKTPEN